MYSSRLYAQKTLCSKLFKRARRSVQRECSAESFMRSILSLRISTSLPGSRLRILSRCKSSAPTSTPLYNSINRLYVQNPLFEIVRDEGVKVYLHIMYNGNVQQNPLCVESCVTTEFSISPRFSPTIFDPDANSVLLRAHLCTAAGRVVLFSLQPHHP